jgi:hypothetical protein
MKHVFISRLVEHSLARWYLFRPDPTVIESLLIISFVPAGPGVTIRQDLARLCAYDPLGAGGIAHVMARQTDLEHSVKIVSTEVGGLGGAERDEWPIMNKLCLVSTGIEVSGDAELQLLKANHSSAARSQWASVNHRQAWCVSL